MATRSWFQKRDIHQFTWISNDGHTRKELDHILACPLSIVRPYLVYRGAKTPANTDHLITFLLITEIAIAFQHVHKHLPQFNPLNPGFLVKKHPNPGFLGTVTKIFQTSSVHRRLKKSDDLLCSVIESGIFLGPTLSAGLKEADDAE